MKYHWNSKLNRTVWAFQKQGYSKYFAWRYRTQVLFSFEVHSFYFKGSLALILRPYVNQEKLIVCVFGKLALANLVSNHVRQFLFLKLPARIILTFRSCVWDSRRRSTPHKFAGIYYLNDPSWGHLYSSHSII